MIDSESIGELNNRLDKLPHTSLAILPTPIQMLRNFGACLGGPELWMKRDDLTGLEGGGNKIRKLEYVVGDAIQQGADMLVTSWVFNVLSSLNLSYTSPGIKEMASTDKIEVENINCPGLTKNVDARKYEAMKKVLLKVVPKSDPGITQKEMQEAILPHLPQNLWPGGSKSGWWAKTVQLDLEAKDLLLRSKSKPLRWRRP